MSAKGGLRDNPGFNPHIFDFGRHIGSQPDLGGVDPQALLSGNLWDQPFQDPYQAGPNTPMGMGAPAMGAPQMGGDMPPDLEGALAQGGIPHPQHSHPGLRAVGEYLGSDSFKDSLLGGIIAGQMATNPQGALQLALQWRQHKDQRRFQAEQSQLQRDAVAQNIKARAEIEKGNKEQADIQKRIAKLQAGMQVGNVPPEVVQQWIADHGPLDADNLTQAESDFAVFQSQAKAKKDAEKQVGVDIKNKQTIASSAAKNGTILGSEYTKLGNPKYDADLAKSLPILAQSRRDMEDTLAKLRSARIDREKALTKLTNKKTAAGTPDVVAKNKMARNKQLFGMLEKEANSTVNKLLEAKATAAAYSGLDASDPTTGPLKTNAEATVETYQNQLDDIHKKIIENEDEFKTLNGQASAADDIDFEGTLDEGDVPEEAAALLKAYPGTRITLPKGVVTPPKFAVTPAVALPPNEAAPADDIAIYQKIVAKYGMEKANAAWAERHGNAPPPSGIRSDASR